MNRTACHAWHIAHGARMVDFAGWDMPVQYTTIGDEHQAVRQAAGMFDIAHMGRITFRGPATLDLLQRITTNDAGRLEPGQVQYSLVVNEAGGVLDDVLVYRLADHSLMVVNASNREKILGWIERHRDGLDVEVEDRTRELFMLAVQGPHAQRIVQPLVSLDLSSVAYYHAAWTEYRREACLVSRTGYTGEDGFELIVPVGQAEALWDQLWEAGRPLGLKPAGLGARDTLRLDAGMCLYGHELSESINPYAAGLSFAVALDKPGGFIGQEALRRLRAEPGRRRVGLELAGRRIARQGHRVLVGERCVGEVTSGTFSPTLQRAIAMALVEPEARRPGTRLAIDVRGQPEPATVVKLPFYHRAHARGDRS